MRKLELVSYILKGAVALQIISAMPTAAYQASVIEVLDGDTIKVTYKSKVQKIRLNRIDAPEKQQLGGYEATEYLKSLLRDKNVSIKKISTDRYQRVLAEITLSDGRNVSDWMVLEGHAWWYRQYAKKDKVLPLFEEHARSHELGLWRVGNPMPPWIWRHK